MMRTSRRGVFCVDIGGLEFLPHRVLANGRENEGINLAVERACLHLALGGHYRRSQQIGENAFE